MYVLSLLTSQEQHEPGDYRNAVYLYELNWKIGKSPLLHAIDKSCEEHQQFQFNTRNTVYI